MYICQERLGEGGGRREASETERERGERRAILRETREREGREWERGELYMYIIVYNCILYI